MLVHDFVENTWSRNSIESSGPTAYRSFGASIAGELRFLHTDDEASVAVVTDGDGDVVQHYRYPSDHGRVEAYVGATQIPVALRDAPFPQPYTWHSRRVEIGAAPEELLDGADPRFYNAETQPYLQRMSETPAAGESDDNDLACRVARHAGVITKLERTLVRGVRAGQNADLRGRRTLLDRSRHRREQRGGDRIHVRNSRDDR